MSEINIIFPHQLFENSSLLENGNKIYLIEEYLFFNQYAFHKQKIAFHRASMKSYYEFLSSKSLSVQYIESTEKISDIREFLKSPEVKDVKTIHYVETTDFWLDQRIRKGAGESDISLIEYPSLLFLNSLEELSGFFKAEKKKFFQTSFYKSERVKRNILIEGDNNPVGGKWTYDDENREKYPKDKNAPAIRFPDQNAIRAEATEYVENNFSTNPGELSSDTAYPIDFAEAKQWFDEFLEQRFQEFGVYEDAIVKEEIFLNHSLLSPLLNTGLLNTNHVIRKALAFASKNDVPINSLEGFLRQIIGWREFIRGIYECKGSYQRTLNFWGFDRKIPKSFYDGSTGIEPLDDTIKKVLKSGYCHHIERLMILGNFMVLCEFDPDEVYHWFMELFIDAYDWVMVPNVYGMSQFADGGLMATKPYISGSNYIMKMSNYSKGSWQGVWDALFWRFMHVHRDFFQQNARLGMLIGTFDKMDEEKQKELLARAELFLENLSK